MVTFGIFCYIGPSCHFQLYLSCLVILIVMVHFGQISNFFCIGVLVLFSCIGTFWSHWCFLVELVFFCCISHIGPLWLYGSYWSFLDLCFFLVLLLLSALVERVGVSRMRDFLKIQLQSRDNYHRWL